VNWTQTLSANHTDPQPLPGQHLTATYTNGKTTHRTARTPRFVPFLRIDPTHDVHVEPIQSSVDGRTIAVVVRNWDNRHGLGLAQALENFMGVDVLEGKGTKNICSAALGFTCARFCDNFIKLWPLMGAGPGGNFGGDVSNTGLPRMFLDNFVKGVANMARANPDIPDIRSAVPAPSSNKGLLQIQRYAQAGKWNKRNSSRLHMHVDTNPHSAGLVAVLSLGNTVEFLLDDGKVCQHNLQYRAMGIDGSEQGRRKTNTGGPHYAKRPHKEGEDLKKWDQYTCPTCHTVELRSGDVVLFDGRRAAQVAHGIQRGGP
jgi:hypothetical protein